MGWTKCRPNFCIPNCRCRRNRWFTEWTACNCKLKSTYQQEISWNFFYKNKVFKACDWSMDCRTLTFSVDSRYDKHQPVDLCQISLRAFSSSSSPKHLWHFDFFPFAQHFCRLLVRGYLNHHNQYRKSEKLTNISIAKFLFALGELKFENHNFLKPDKTLNSCFLSYKLYKLHEMGHFSRV